MPIFRRQPRIRTKRRVDVEIDSAAGGTNTLLSESRLDKNEAKELLNMWLVEDGVPDKRPGTAHYGGVTFTNRPDGAWEYVTEDAERELIVVADGSAYVVDPDAGTKTAISGGTFTAGNRVYFKQFNNYLYIANGVNALARYDGSSIVTYSGLAAPAWDGTPLTRLAGLAAGSTTYYYQVTATNAVGETVASTEQSITVDILREDWDEADEGITLAFADVAGAVSYNIYVTDTSGFEEYLDTVTTSAYTDMGGTTNPYIVPPDENTTTAPLFTHMTVSGNRLWATGNPSSPYRVYFTGTGQERGNFAPGAGGGYIDLEKGGKDTTVAIIDFQSVAHAFMKSADGRGSIWQITIESVEVLDETFDAPIPKKIIPSIGTNSARSVIHVENDVFFYNKAGVYVLGNEPNIQNVLRTNELSAKIRPYILALSGDSVDKVAAYYYQARAYFSVSSATGEPDRTIVFDRERGAWIQDWSIGVSQFLEFTDSEGATHLLGIASDRLIEFSTSFEGDSGAAFTWRYTTGRSPVVDDWSKYARIRKSKIRLRNASGNVDVSISGTGRENQLNSVAAASIAPGSSNAGMGWDEMGSVMMGDTAGTPSVFATESLIRYLTLSSGNNLLRDIQWSISGDGLNDRAIITGLMAQGFETNLPLPLSDKV